MLKLILHLIRGPLRSRESLFLENVALRRVWQDWRKPLACVLVIEDPSRFRNSRSVGAFLGLRPRQKDSGKIQKQLRITKAGDSFLRSLLVQCAQYMLGPFGQDCDLRDGDTRSPYAAARTQSDELLSPSRGSWLACSIVCGSRRTNINR
jgi:hypothetical protein